MMFSSNAFRSALVLLLAAARNAVTSATAVVNLGTAENFAILTKTGISTVPDSVITGDIGVSPIKAAAMTGFDLTMEGLKYSASEQITGKAYAADYATPVPVALTTAVSDMETAYTDAAGRPNTNDARINLGGGLLGNAYGGADSPLTAGVYTFGSDVNIVTDIYFEGSETDVFIIQMTGNLVQEANVYVFLAGGALAKNIYWQVAGNVAVGAGAKMQGILLVQTDVLFGTESSLIGRVLAQTACNLKKATIYGGTPAASIAAHSAAPSAAPSATPSAEPAQLRTRAF
jgi:hypothetical protein